MKKIFNSDFKVTQIYGGDHTLTINKKEYKASDYYGKFGLKGHEGIDLIPSDNDWTVKAAADGVVVRDDDFAGDPKADVYGIYVTIWHPQLKKATQYCHLESNQVFVNQQIKAGEPIGKMGKTGNTSGAHLHLNLFEVDDKGYRLNKDNGFMGGVDPLPFLNEGADKPTPTETIKKVRVISDLPLRARQTPTINTANTKEGVVKSYPKSTELEVLEELQGQEISGNKIWYLIKEKPNPLYIWSGAVEDVNQPKKEEPKKEEVKSEPTKPVEVKPASNIVTPLERDYLERLQSIYKITKDILEANNALPDEKPEAPSTQTSIWTSIKEFLRIA